MGWMRAAAAAVRDSLLPPRVFLELGPEHTFDTAPRPVDQVIASMRSGDTARVSRDEALSVAAVQRGRNEVCSISTLPLRLYRGLEVVDSALFRQFDPDVPNVVHMAMTIEDLAFEAIAWWQVTSQTFEGYPASVRRIDPGKVTLKNPGKSMDPAEERRWVWIDHDDGKGPQRWPAALMIRFDSPNPGLLKCNGRAVRIAIKLARLTEMYADNPALREWFTDNPDFEGSPYTQEDIDAYLAEFAAMRRLSPVGWIPRQVQRAEAGGVSPKDLTLAELTQQVTLDIANGIGVDPEDLGVSTTSRTYFNSVDKKQDKINRTYAPYMSAVTDRLGMGDVTPRGYAPRFDLTDYLKSSPSEQAAYWTQLEALGVTDAAEIRGWAGLSGAPPTPAAVSPALAAADAPGRGIAAARVAGRRFDGEAPAHTFAAMDFATPPPAPAVDQEARTITGLAVPYSVPTQRYGITLMFDPGSLEYSDPAHMPHLVDHSTPVGFHRSITDGPAGPVVALAVLPGREGSTAHANRDDLLFDAANGLYSGLSVGVDFSMFPEDGDVEIDDDGVYHVVRAQWRETSTTYMPQFDDARVTSVAASRTGGNTVECQYCHGAHAPGISCATFAARQQPTPIPPTPQTPPEPQPRPLPVPEGGDYAAFQAWQRAHTPAAGPVPVSPHQGFVQVTEPLPYRYDRKGNLRAGTHDFSTDIAVAHNPNYHGPESREAADARITGWLKYAFGDGDGDRHLGNLALPGDAAQQQFAITPANVTNLNYPQNRPDMYVDQLDYLYPMYEAFNKGTLDVVTPFVLPKFNASSGLVADHVTGTEPTPGAFTATAQTVTPTALSGKVEITREVFDQGGNPQASGLIWRQMVRGWYEGIEAAIQAFFVAQAASIPDITLGVAVTDAAMDQSLASAITALQFIRGGDRFSRVFTQIDLYQKLAKAVDTTGRPLYPTFGAMNTSGSMAPDQNYLNVRGKTFVPAWATAATGSVLASSWMMDPDVVGVWLSTPQRIDLQWRVAWVDLGIWGYKALAITDFTRTRELTYDPV
jgi:hypothetical protein